MELDRRTFLAGALSAGAAAAMPQEEAAKPERLAPIARAGYVSKPAARADETRWVQIDLGSKVAIDAVKLYPAQDNSLGNALPVRFRIEASDDPQFGSPAMVTDHGDHDFTGSRDVIHSFEGHGASGRYVRLTAIRLRQRRPNEPFRLALAKFEVISNGKDAAEGRPMRDSSGESGVTPLTRPPRPMGEGIHTDNPDNVTSDRDWRPVAYRARAPLSGVKLAGGVFHTALENNVQYLMTSFTEDELVRQFRARAGKPNPPGMRPPDRFWEEDLAGSNAGRFLMGAGNAVRWTDHPELRQRIDRIIDVIEECRQPNGYIMAYPEDSIFHSEHAGYTRAWVTHGMIEAGYSGNPKAFGLLRGYYDWFDQCPYLPEILRGAQQGVQGMIANTRMYFTPAGRPKDLQIIQRYFQENYWLEGLAKRDPAAVWQYPYDRPHCYLLTDLEAYLDLYRATGARRYLDAALGGWELYRENWEHVGGTISICEFDTYPPKSYPLHLHTGELCGSVFWSLLSQRLHFLYPEEERYVAEIEKSIYNIGLANQIGTKGYLYHAHLVGRKGDASPSWAPGVNTCCAGQGTRFAGTLPEFIYSIADDGLYVNLFEPSRITWKGLELAMATRFPLQPDVELRVGSGTARAKIRIRVPSWATRAMEIRVNGRRAAEGRPGTYALLDRAWRAGDAISFTLPVGLRATRYTGVERTPGEERYAVEYGPVLMAVVGEVDEKSGATIRCRPEELTKQLRPAPGEELHFAIEGDRAHRWVPYWRVANEAFTCYPVVTS